MKKRNNSIKILIVAGALVFAALVNLGTDVIWHASGPDSDKSDSVILLNSYVNQPDDIGIPAKKFFAVAVDDKNNKWFLTELGLISFTGEKWTLYNNIIQGKEIKDIAFETGTEGTGFWITTGSGITSVIAPAETDSNSVDYNMDNASILSNNVVKVAIGNNKIKWFGTDKGVSAFNGNKWLDIGYDDLYPAVIFQEYPISSLATNSAGDSLYIGTKGAGIARVYKNEVDGISGASVYAMWGPIILPSDNVISIFIAKDGTKWFGTDMGVASHYGSNTLENWNVYTTAEGLVNDVVQSITADHTGGLWFGTQGGISVFDGSAWLSYTKDNGLNSNDILCLAVDNNGVVWIGTDDGVTSFSNGVFTGYR